jgi:hypothetical protein
MKVSAAQSVPMNEEDTANTRGVLRLYPINPINSRTARIDTTLPRGGGDNGTSPIFVAKGETVVFSSLALHRRKDIFGEDAGMLKPDKWDKKKPSTYERFSSSRLRAESANGQQVGIYSIWRWPSTMPGPATCASRSCVHHRTVTPDISHDRVCRRRQVRGAVRDGPDKWRWMQDSTRQEVERSSLEGTGRQGKKSDLHH